MQPSEARWQASHGRRGIHPAMDSPPLLEVTGDLREVGAALRRAIAAKAAREAKQKHRTRLGCLFMPVGPLLLITVAQVLATADPGGTRFHPPEFLRTLSIIACMAMPFGPFIYLMRQGQEGLKGDFDPVAFDIVKKLLKVLEPDLKGGKLISLRLDGRGPINPDSQGETQGNKTPYHHRWLRLRFRLRNDIRVTVKASRKGRRKSKLRGAWVHFDKFQDRLSFRFCLPSPAEAPVLTPVDGYTSRVICHQSTVTVNWVGDKQNGQFRNLSLSFKPHGPSPETIVKLLLASFAPLRLPPKSA